MSASGSVDRDSEEFDETGFAASVGGGVDIAVTPTVAVRAIEFDYFPYRHGNGDSFMFNNIRWRSGIVISLH